MAAEQNPRPMALCELCFLEEHTKWEPESMDENGTVLMKLVGVDAPNRNDSDTIETCCMCGCITVAGIFEIRTPNEVYFLEDNNISNDYVMSLEEDYFDEDDKNF